MRVSRLKTILLLSSFLLTLFSIPITVRADDNDDADDYDVKARVARISMLDGEVSLKRNDSKDWEAAKLNYPVVEGDTVTTAANSNLEIQVDARNFIRLSGNSVLRIITLRDEGIAISVVEGTVTVRLANFDRKRGYFEVDAPKSTLAAEKNGLYRIDVPKNGRVRLTVREGGGARIYSDTSGFSLRDGRAAELVIDGENAGDWDLMAAAPPDEIDNSVADRERYLAQRLKYDVKYYDEYVWGGEDLDAYGDWIKTDDYGWVWRPFPSSISVYSDWVPYRYGQWSWCPPYGWTWIGYEPWGWAPYHYGRWVYFNGYWAWCPRNQFYRNRSWWRPALVAFVFDFSFGDNVCWYPLSYHQRDPHSRRYRHDRDRDRHPGYGGGRDSDGRQRHDGHENWRGVTRTPRRDFGNPYRRPQVVEEPIARRVVDSDPERGDLPRRGGWGRVPMANVPERPTGAAERAPGVALDEDLRRNRVFRGREPRTNQPAQPNTSAPAVNTNAPVVNTETQPTTGAVERPEPRGRRGEPRTEPLSGNPEDRRGRDRPERPRTREGSENAGGSSTEAPTENAPRNEQPPAVTEPPRETPRVERREREAPEVRSQSGNESRPRFEPRTEPRSEPRESRPETRSESPRSESPRSESPRSEPRHESPRSESPRSESPRSESPRSEPSRSESPRSEAPRSEPSRSESPRSEAPRESPRSDPESSRPKPDKPMF
jgi:hypothetical protein